MEKKRYNVYLGRFCPLHRGHEQIISSVIEKYGSDNLIVIIGSSTSLNNRTPFTFEQRKKMIRTVFPNIVVLGLPDIKPNNTYFSDETTNEWLNSIKHIEQKMNGEFKFFGGSKTDMEILGKGFTTEVIVDRESGEKISATKIRAAFDSKKFDDAKKMMSEKVFDDAIKYYEDFKKTK